MEREDIVQLLKDHNCTLIRDGNHLVYRLPSGKNFVMSKTPSDFRSERNNLAILKRSLGLERPEKVVRSPTAQPSATHTNGSPSILQDLPTTLELSIEEQLASERRRYDFLLEEAAKAERNIAMLSTLQAFADMPDTEPMLRAVLGEQSPIKGPTPDSGVHKGAVTRTVQVTKQLVLAATSMFERTFSLNDLLEKMVGEEYGKLEDLEQKRIRSSVISSINVLIDNGQVRRTMAGVGRRPAVYARVATPATAAIPLERIENIEKSSNPN